MAKGSRSQWVNKTGVSLRADLPLSHVHAAKTQSTVLPPFFLYAETDRDGEKKWSKERTSIELPCVWHREVQTLKGFEDLLTNHLKINLDPKRSLGGDYRSLAGAFGKDMKYIWFLESQSSPIEELLKKCRPSLRFLIDTLSSKAVDRKDVAKEIIAWVEQNCTCSCPNCAGSSLL